MKSPHKSYFLPLEGSEGLEDEGALRLVAQYDHDGILEGVLLQNLDHLGRVTAQTLLAPYEARRLAVALIDRVAEPEVLP